jgi:lysophospholipase L1-like esterase
MTVLRGPALSLASLLVFAALVEIAFRVLGPFAPGYYRTGPLIEPDPVLGWRHIPSETTWFRTPEFTSRADTGRDGRLGPEVMSAAGRPLVLLMGDSFVGATQLPYEQTMAGRLVAALPRAVVVNDGVSGYGTDQEVLLLRREAMALRPDAIIVVFTVANDVWNDDWSLEARHPTYPKPYFDLDAAGVLDLRPLAQADIGLIDRLRPVLAHSQVLTVIKTGIIDRLLGSASDQATRLAQLDVLDEPRGEWIRAWTIAQRLVERLASEAAGSPTLLVIAPDPCQVHADLCSGRTALSRSDVPQRLLSAAAAHAGIRVLDLTPALRTAAARGERVYFPLDLHWNAAGARLAAEAIAASAGPLLAK